MPTIILRLIVITLLMSQASLAFASQRPARVDFLIDITDDHFTPAAAGQ